MLVLNSYHVSRDLSDYIVSAVSFQFTRLIKVSAIEKYVLDEWVKDCV